MNPGVPAYIYFFNLHASFWILAWSIYMPSSRIAGSYGDFVFSFLRTLHTVLHSGCTGLQSHQWCRSFSFSPHPLQHLLLVDFFFVNFLMMTPDFLMMTTDFLISDHFLIAVLICTSLIISDVEHLFMCLLAICMSFLEKCFLGLPPTYWLGFFLLFWYLAAWAICKNWSLISCWLHHLQIFSPILWVFCFVYGFLSCTKAIEFN